MVNFICYLSPRPLSFVLLLRNCPYFHPPHCLPLNRLISPFSRKTLLPQIEGIKAGKALSHYIVKHIVFCPLHAEKTSRYFLYTSTKALIYIMSKCCYSLNGYAQPAQQRQGQEQGDRERGRKNGKDS